MKSDVSHHTAQEILETTQLRSLVENAEERGYIEPAELEALALELDLADDEVAELDAGARGARARDRSPQARSPRRSQRLQPPSRSRSAPATACSSSSPTSAATSC